eukprot:GCRY01000165.1.p1 GENE.GCRY01000165.1~~GCRY01000165.1.p1  ORF type:complete len:1223 (+),score=453.10 GCRY01000165.1:114-3782(+)
MTITDYGEELFTGISSLDFLKFNFNDNTYQSQLDRAIKKTGQLCGVRCFLRTLEGRQMVWLKHNFGFLGGSLGCAEGAKIVKGIELAIEKNLPVVLDCCSGGARMQEGTLSLMQMAKVSVAVDKLKTHKLPVITLNRDPTYGGVSASYAMQGDIRIGVTEARIGFAGPAVILTTMFENDQAKCDEAQPEGFQSAEFLQKHGQLDIVIEEEKLDETVSRCFNIIMTSASGALASIEAPAPEKTMEPDYQKSRHMDRLQAQDLYERVFSSYVELNGDGRVGDDQCLRGGLAFFEGRPCVVLATTKGHTPKDMRTANFGMSSPHGYRVALKLMRLAEHFGLPVFTIIDTCGAYPSFESEADGQSEALATNLLTMSGLKVPIFSLVIGEGGSGGALGIAMGNRVGMLSNAYYGVISPEGAASILGRYKDDAHKAQQFPKDCRALANKQKVYARDLITLGVIDEIIPEEEGETYSNCPALLTRIKAFFIKCLTEFDSMTAEKIVSHRHNKFFSMGKFEDLSEEQRKAAVDRAAANAQMKERVVEKKEAPQPIKELDYLAEQTLNGKNSFFKGTEPKGMENPVAPRTSYTPDPAHETFKTILDRDGPDAVVNAIKSTQRVLITDTTMRDAHQSLLATRVRTTDLLAAASETACVLKDAFSIEMWGGATFDVAMRFLHEDPWTRLRELRKKIPNVLFQMLIRGANAVGYKSYPDNVVVKFIELAAKNGMDVFRIFDCFNDLEQMKLCIDTVRRVNKIAEVCICFTGNFLSEDEKIYTLQYYKDLAKTIVDAGAHIIAVKDMAGLLKPQMAEPFMNALREVTDIPVHYHTHNTSSAALATCLNMARAGCKIVDLCMASMADTTSQPSMNAFLSSMDGEACSPGIDYLSLEKLDIMWQGIRSMYSPLESGLKSGSARVYDHQIPGGQYSNLYSQNKSLGRMDRWEQVLNMYRDVNRMFGDIVKVTPSSKCVGDMALFLVTNNLTCEDILKGDKEHSFPDSVVSLFRGELGGPHFGLPKELYPKVLNQGQTVLKERPGKTLPPADFEAERTMLQLKYGREFCDEEVVCHLLYPKVYEDYLAKHAKHGDNLTFIPTKNFFYGMELKKPITVAGDVIVLERVKPLEKGHRVCLFKVNGVAHEVRIKIDLGDDGPCDLPVADPKNAKQVGSPLPGNVDKIFFKPGDAVKKGDKVMIVSAMKMEVVVAAPEDGTIKSFGVTVNMKVDQGTLVFTMA